jgi:hypothetical protein
MLFSTAFRIALAKHEASLHCIALLCAQGRGVGTLARTTALEGSSMGQPMHAFTPSSAPLTNLSHAVVRASRGHR